MNKLSTFAVLACLLALASAGVISGGRPGIIFTDQHGSFDLKRGFITVDQHGASDPDDTRGFITVDQHGSLDDKRGFIAVDQHGSLDD
ncbi:hypothetical protein B0H16DRAFT_1889560 [Mycena metata]|uniref:Uncharacterized protein n=1 Tax=Mycena metata TaxID=1033252 RepID=A0AAD7N3Y4_9AGAR|nr:hypothetical protein B0H16DRAFT_1889560 [Mycena metata]